MKEIVNHPQFQELESLMRQKMADLSDEIDYTKSASQIGMQARANYLAKKVLKEFLQEISFFKVTDEAVKKRDFR